MNPGNLWGREPAMVLALVQAVIVLGVAFGLARRYLLPPRGLLCAGTLLS